MEQETFRVEEVPRPKPSIDLIASGRVSVQGLITHRYGLGEIARAFETALDKSSRSIKVEICQEL